MHNRSKMFSAVNQWLTTDILTCNKTQMDLLSVVLVLMDEETLSMISCKTDLIQASPKVCWSEKSMAPRMPVYFHMYENAVSLIIVAPCETLQSTDHLFKEAVKEIPAASRSKCLYCIKVACTQTPLNHTDNLEWWLCCFKSTTFQRFQLKHKNN